MLKKEILYKETEKAINWIKEYVENSNSNGIIIGISGGKDSATVLAMSIKAIGKDKIKAVYMPCFSNINDYEDAKLISETFGVNLLELNLDNVYKEFSEEINKKINLSYEASINIKPRLRMISLYAIARTLNYLVIGTGNLSESVVGYTTKWGDSSSDFNPIGNFTVDEVLEIGKILGVPDKILKKSPSDGLSEESDEDKMGIKYSQIEEMIETGNTEENAKKEILRRFKNSKHKRILIPTYNFNRVNYLKDK